MPSSHLPSTSKRAAHIPPRYYRLIINTLKPLYRAQVWRRSHKRDNYQQEVAQRFGKRYPPRPVASAKQSNKPLDVNNLSIDTTDNLIGSASNKVIWCHAVSLGETNTVAPLLDALLAKGYQIWLTNTTQTGHARGASRFANEIAQGRMSHSYVPVDTPTVIETFLAHVQPIAALFVETELWANILTALAQQNIPSIIVNGRLSASSFASYQKIGAVSASMMHNLTLIIAQDDDSAKRFRQLGADSAKIRVAGSLKWVINTPQISSNNDDNDNSGKVGGAEDKITDELKEAARDKSDSDSVSLQRPIWVAASTHGGEEHAALLMQQQLLSVALLKGTLLIIVPRHPERFDEVATLIEQSGLQMARRSRDESISAQTQVYLADSMGELMQWYTQADVALVGGSIVDIGGHNPVEPASVATPVLMGKYTQSCQSVVNQLASVGALYQSYNEHYQALTGFVPVIKDKIDFTEEIDLLYQQLAYWLGHLPVTRQAGQAGQRLTDQQQSVLSHQLAMIETVIERSQGSEGL